MLRQWMADLGGDVRHAIRASRAHAGLTATVVLTAAIGIGATSAVFSLVHAVLVRPLPYPDPDRLVVVMTTWRGREPMAGVSTPKFVEWRRGTSAFEQAAAYRVGGVSNVTSHGQPSQVDVGRASAELFSLFGARSARGRTFAADEDRPNGPAVVVVSDGFWRQRMGGAPDAVGERLLLDGAPHEVIGILEAGFDAEPLTLSLAPTPELWVPLRIDPASESDAPFLAAARLREGTPLETARAQTAAAAEAIRRSFPAVMPEPAGLTVAPLHSILVRDVRPALLLLLGAVTLVLLIVCANTAHLLLVRASARQREMAIRLTAGASRSRIVRQLLAESLLLSLTGGLLGVYLAISALRAFISGYAGAMPRSLGSAALPIDVPMLGFTLVVSVAAGVLFGLVPALQASRVNLDAALRSGGDPSGANARHRWRGLFVISEMALALMLLVGSGLLVRSYAALRTLDPGFDARDVWTIQMPTAGEPFSSVDAASETVHRALERIVSEPGVTAAAATLTGAPLSGVTSFLNVTVPGRVLDGPYFRGGYLGGWQVISPRYFNVLSIPVVAGRQFTDGDTRGAAPVVVINQRLARQIWPGENPLGQYLLLGEGAGAEFDERTPRQVVGIVGDVRHVGLEWDPRPTAYVPLAQIAGNQLSVIARNGGRMTWLVRSPAPFDRIGRSIERELQEASGGVTLAGVRSMQEVSRSSSAPTELNMSLMTLFASCALFLAAIGVFGVMACTIRERTREIGIRVALGAADRAVRNMVLKDGMTLALAGIALGTAAALGFSRLLQTLLFGVAARDWAVFVSMPLLLGAVALVAVWLPARRATSIDAMMALRHE